MKDLIIILISALSFIVIVFLLSLGIEKTIFRLPVYFLPNGLVLNFNEDYRQYWGHRLSIEDVEFAKNLNTYFSYAEHEVRIYDKLEKVQIGKFFFIHISKYKIFKDFFSEAIISMISFVAAIWFFYYIRDFYLFLFFLSISLSLLFGFLFIAFDMYHFFFYTFNYLTSFNIFNLSYRFKGKEIKAKWVIPQLILASLAGFVAETEKSNIQILSQLGIFGLLLMVSGSIIASISLFYDILRYRQQPDLITRKLCLIGSFLVIILVGITYLFQDPFGLLKYPRYYKLPLFLLFLILFVYGTYRYSLFPTQIFFNPSIINIFLVVFLLAIFVATSIITHLIKIDLFILKPEYFNPLFLFIIVIYVLQLKLYIQNTLDRFIYKGNDKISKSLENIRSFISSPISMKYTVSSISREMMETLNIKNIMLLLSGDQFPDFEFKDVNIIRLSSNSDLWEFFQNSQDVIVTSHLAYGMGIRGKIYDFLASMDIQIAYPLRDPTNKNKNRGIILIGEKLNKQNFSLVELRYIREVGRLTSMLLENYTLLADDIEKKKIIRNITTASVIENTLNLVDKIQNPNLKINYFSIPAVEISGDYLDFIELNSNQVAFFLGDVSGHGLGTGYLVTAIKAMVRELIMENEPLDSIFYTINEFFIQKYGGNDFMSLIGGIINTKDYKLDYINAGHPGFILIQKDGNLKHYNDTERVLGIIQTHYKIKSFYLEPGEKIILYSDGITETFSMDNRMFGEENLFGFLKFKIQLSPHEMQEELQETLKKFRGGQEMTDDATFVCISLVSG